MRRKKNLIGFMFIWFLFNFSIMRRKKNLIGFMFISFLFNFSIFLFFILKGKHYKTLLPRKKKCKVC